MKSPRLLQITTYPAWSLLLAIVLLGYFYLRSHMGLRELLPIPASVFISPISEWLMLGFGLCVFIELRWVHKRRRKQRLAAEQLHTQIEELLENKKQLSTKAHVYAGHADKLKLFISDKLLEYIEYDEKFLHFKSIASEVRHNGVISYDKVSTILEQQLATITDSDSEAVEQLSEAKDSLRYLWDLLDLSTADNIALHIANQVCEAEELLFQSELNTGDVALPEKPVFDPQQALQKALARCFGSTPLRLEGDGDTEHLQIVDHEAVWIRCHPTAPLLGNANHTILALENLINNAQFFAGRKGTRRSPKRARIAIQLQQQDGYIKYTVYNSGPTINEETAAKLFQLGFSTRRVKEHHGKGLGLYFVNEIVKGYDGRVAFRNVVNQPDVLSLRLEMANGEVITEVIELLAQDDRSLCRKTGAGSAEETLDWELYGEVKSIEVTHQSDQKTHPVQRDTLVGDCLFDPSRPAHPRWRLEIDNSRRAATLLKFKPLDIHGVVFEIRLPSLTARLEGELLATDEEDMERQIASISGQFKALED